MINSTPFIKESSSSEAGWALIERIAESPQLRRAPRLREFLFFVGRRALQEGSGQLHEQEIGVKVFGRPATYDTGADNIVRANASELRKRIHFYFQTDGQHEELLMEIPRGSYIPVFKQRQSDGAIETTMAPGTPVLDNLDIPRAERALAAHRLPLFGVAAIVAVAIGCCFFLWLQNRSLQRMLNPLKNLPTEEALWSSFLESSQSTDIVMEDDSFLLVQNLGNQTFSLDDYLNRTYLSKLQAQKFTPEMHNAQTLIAGKTLARAAEVRLVKSILVLDPLGKNLHVYNAREYTPDLFTRDNVILFGSPTSNPWDELIESRLNFTEEANSRQQSGVTNHSPAAGEQRLYTATADVAYCAIAYLPKMDHSGNLLLIQGTSSEATEAGGQFLLSEDQLSALRKRPTSGKFPYFEVLLRVSHVTGTPITATIEAYRNYPNLQ